MITIKQLPRPIILELHFKTIKDEDVHIGQWIVLWSQILVRKIGKDLYEAYILDESLAESAEQRIHRLTLELIKNYEENVEKRLKNTLALIDPDMPKVFYPEKRYRKTKHGSKRVRPWESPKYFG